MRLRLLPLLPLFLLTGVLAQDPPTLPELSKRLSAAAATKDPAARVEALQQFLQLPNLPAPILSSAQRQFVIALVKHDPAAAPKAVATLAKNTKGDDQARLFQTLSSEL
ncbi:MAG TPA: hypothetical protein PLF84_15550, partial [Bryobacteraceae bacterium]|nr:hypothetical protein [Bryobacteraceae bacterium]